MGGIIQGFLGGVGKGMADAGQMFLANQLAGERDEADHLRRTELAKTDRDFRSSEAELGRLHTTETASTKTSAEIEADRIKAAADKLSGDEDRKSKEKIADAKAKALVAAAGGQTPTSQMKNLDDLMKNRGLDLQGALQVVYPGATVKHTDVEGNLSVAVIDAKTGKMKNIGTFMINDAGIPEFVEPGKSPKQTKPTKKEREAEAARMNKESGADDDYIPFNELGPRDEAVRQSAQEALDKKNQGIVGSQVDGATDPQVTPPAPVDPTGAQAMGETKMVGKKEMNKEEFIQLMVKQYGQDKIAEIEATWDQI